jgi:hypothetical protein
MGKWSQAVNNYQNLGKIGVTQQVPQEFEYDPDEDVFEDGEGIDFLNFDQLQISDKTDEEEEADAMYSDYDENEMDEY